MHTHTHTHTHTHKARMLGVRTEQEEVVRQLQSKVAQTVNNMSRINLSGYVGHVTIFS